MGIKNLNLKPMVAVALSLVMALTTNSKLSASCTASASSKSDIVKTLLDEEKPEEKVVVLTFDDGPCMYTEKLLDTLDEYGVKATFFVVGWRIKRNERNRAIVLDAYNRGHDIAIHGYSHELFTQMTIEEVNDEIEKTQLLLEEIGVEVAPFIRAPGGTYNQKVLDEANLDGERVPFIGWDFSAVDTTETTKEKIASRIYANLDDEGSIILLHDIKKPSVNAMGTVLPKLIEQGYSFKTVSQVVEGKEESIEPGYVYKLGSKE